MNRVRGGASAIFTFSIAWLLTAGTASAAGLFTPVSGNDVAAAALQVGPRDPLIKRSRLVRLDTNELTSHVAPAAGDMADRMQRAERLDGVVTIELFPDTVATFRRSNVDQVGDSLVWNGSVSNRDVDNATLIVEDGVVAGHVQLDNRVFRIAPQGNGLHRVIELDPRKFGPDHPAGYRYDAPTGAGIPRGHTQNDQGVAAPAVTIYTVRVFAGFTSRASSQAKSLYGGGTNQAIVNQIKLAIALANQAYAKNTVPLKVELAGPLSTGAYIEWSTLQANIAVLRGESVGGYPPELQPLRAKRESTKSDLLALFTGIPSDGACGIGGHTDMPSAATKNSVFTTAINFNCVSGHSFAHELGHNMSLRHDRFVDKAAGVGYNFGYVNKTAGCMIRDIMAYNNACGNQFCARQNVFSTDRITVKVGAKQCVIGINKGKPAAADAEQRLKETVPAISLYR